MLIHVGPSIYLVKSGDGKGVVQYTAASAETVKAWDMNGILANESESQ